MTTLTAVTNELIHELDDNFNDLFRSIENMNSVINNKENMLAKENLEIIYKDKQINYLYTILIYVLIFCILLILHAMGKINLKKLIIGTIIIILLLGITLLILYRKSINIKILLEKLNLEINMLNIKDVIKNDYKCPSTCKPKGDDVQNEEDTTFSLLTGVNNYPTIDVDQQNNYWAEGNYSGVSPAGASVVETFSNPNKEKAKAYSKTFYKCKWLVGSEPTDVGLPIRDGSIVSTEPCDFKAGYIADNKNSSGIDIGTNKYLCTEPTDSNLKTTTGYKGNLTNCTPF